MKWADDELDTLKRLYPLYGPSWDGWSDVLAGRSKDSLRSKAFAMGVHGPFGRLKWQKFEEDAINAHFQEMGPNWWGWSILLNNRSARAISDKATNMGLRFIGNKEQPRWTNAQRKQLILKTKELVGATGHSLYECLDEYVRLRREAKDSDRKSKGDKK